MIFCRTVKMHNWLSSSAKKTCWIDTREIDILASCQLYLTAEKSSFLFYPKVKRFMEKTFFFLRKSFRFQKSYFFQLKFLIRVYSLCSGSYFEAWVFVRHENNFIFYEMAKLNIKKTYKICNNELKIGRIAPKRMHFSVDSFNRDRHYFRLSPDRNPNLFHLS